jgi:dTDP-glucose 4,6-dehydratase
MKILVTGGCGFIGSNFVEYLLAKYPNAEVRNLDCITYAGKGNEDAAYGKNYCLIKESVADATAVREVLRGVDTVVHFAAESHVTRSEKDPGVFYRTNVEGTKTMLEEAVKAGVKKFIHVSTDEVYGPIVKGYFKETDKAKDNSQATSDYAKSKAEADEVAQSFFGKLPLIIVRPTNNFGPRQYPEKALPRWITNMLLGEKAPIWGEGRQVRDWLFAEDTARALDILLQKGQWGEIYNIGVNHQPEINNKTIALKVAKILGKPESIVELVPDPRPDHDFRYGVDTAKLAALGWKPGNFESQLKTTVEWYRDNKSWWQPLKAEAEKLYKK